MSECTSLEETLNQISQKVTTLEGLTKNRITTIERLIQQLTGRKPEQQNQNNANVQSRLAKLEQRVGRIEQQLMVNNKPSNLEARIKAIENWTKDVNAGFEQVNFVLADQFRTIKLLNDSTLQLDQTEQQIIAAFKKLTKDQLKGVKK